MAAERGIEQTLRDLEMEEDGDLDPGILAQQMAERVAASGKTEVPGASDGEEEDEEEEGEEGEEEEGEEGGEGADAAPPKRGEARSQQRQQRQPRRQRYQRDDEEPGMLPITPALVPPPRTVKGQARAKSPSAGKMGKGIADKVPGAERVKVYKREEDGQSWFVKDYTTQDLKGFPDFESFLTKYVKPGHGAGEYDLVGVDSHLREYPLGTIRLRDPDTKKGSGEVTDLLKTVMTTQQERDESYLKRMQELQRQPSINPMEMLQGAIDMQERLTSKANSEGGGALAAAMKALSESSNQTMTMMMAMMQQQQAAADRSNQMMMTLLAKPKEEDPTMKLILMKLLEGGGGGGGAMPPPPPPSKTEGLADILTAMAAFMGSMGGGGGGDDSKEQLIDFLKQMALKDNGGMSTKEVLQLVMQKNGEPGTDDFRKAVDNMATMMNIANTLRQQGEPGGSAGFFDALSALLGNRDIVGAVANTIRAKTDASEAQRRTQMEAERQRLELAQRMQQRNAALAAQQQAQQLPASQPVQHVQQAPAPVQQPVAPTPEAQRAAENYIKRTGKPIPQLPGNTHEHINMLALAQDEGQLVARTVALFIYFAEFEDWRPFSERLLGLIRDGQKKAAMEHLTAFFEGLAEIKLIDPVLMKRVIKAIDVNFESVQQNLGEFSKEEEEEAGISGEDLVATAEGLTAESA